MEQMWNLVSGRNNAWGINGYEVPKKIYDPIKMKQDKEYFAIATNKAKKPQPKKLDMNVKRGDIIEKEIKRTQSLPGPWKYDVIQPWVKGSAIKLEEKKEHQKLRQIWQGVPKDKQEFTNFTKSKPKKVDMSVQKHSYIDKIYRDNTKKNYPKPGPAEYFMDQKAVSKFHKEKPDLFLVKEIKDEKKTNLPKEPRNFYFSSNQKNGPKIPAPGYTNPDSKKAKPVEEGKITYKRFQDLTKQKDKYEKEKSKRDQERLNDLKEKVKFDINHKNNPIPQDKETFDGMKENFKKMNVKKHPLGFGVGERFEKNEQEKWAKKVGIYNKNAEKPLNPKTDPQPGPAHYNMINHWPGKVTKQSQKQNQEYKNYLSKISKGTSINAYYRIIQFIFNYLQ